MAQAQLELCASAEARAALKNGEIYNTTWNGAGVDTAHISINTFSWMERDLKRILLLEVCSEKGYSSRSRNHFAYSDMLSFLCL